MKNQYIQEKDTIRLLLFRRFLWVSVISVLAIMNVPFVKSIYDKIIQNEMIFDMTPIPPGEIILPEFVLVPSGSFDMGEQDAQFIKKPETG